MASSANVTSMAVRTFVEAVVLIFYVQAFGLAMPYVVVSLVTFDSVGAWMGPTVVVASLGFTQLLGWRSLRAISSGSDPVRSTTIGFIASWSVFNACGVAMTIVL